ncbi:MAG TPA: hypothetical protein VKQ30_07545 [Ktedonobacterales bacterium]|nr:hypothetical protein [Ktedonobacterales bacterium]
MSAASLRSSKDEMPTRGAGRMPVDDDLHQPMPIQSNIPATGDTDVPVAAPVRAGAPAHEAVAADAELRSVDEAHTDEQETILNNLPVSSERESTFGTTATPVVQPPTPASFPPPLTVAPDGASPTDLTYRDVVAPRLPQGWQAPPAEQPRQPTPRPPRTHVTPPPTHTPMLVAQSWGATTLNIQANTAAGASYLLWWLSGLLVYFNERHNRFVRFHAMQSILLTGLLSVYSVFAYLVSGLLYDLAAATNQHAFHTLGTAIAAFSFLAVIGVWIAAMIAAWSGTYLQLPVVGAYAERYAAPPAQPPQF